MRGRTPVYRSKATLKTSALWNPRDWAMLSMLLLEELIIAAALLQYGLPRQIEQGFYQILHGTNE